MLYYWTILLIFVGAIENGHCDIKCYTCSTRLNSGCLNPEGQLETSKCNKEAMMELKRYAEELDSRYSEWFDVDLHTFHSTMPLKCMKQVTKVRGKEYIIRGCQLDSGEPDICTVVTNESHRQNIGNVTHCSLCHTDACNHTSTVGSMSITIILSITFFVKKVILF